jgi:2-oxoglutarate dehydrogenase dihydrolipoamide succinyltransferase (E2 component)
MAIEVTMPQMGESVVEGTIAKWLVKEGDRVAEDQPLCEISTDKVDTEIPSPAAGVVAKIVAAEGETLPVGAVLATIEEAGGATAAAVPAPEKEKPEAAKPAAEAPRPKLEPVRRPATGEARVAVEKPEAVAPVAGKPLKATALAKPAAVPGDHRRYSPVVLKMAAEHGIDLARVPGTGIGGRVSKRDVLKYLESLGQPALRPAPSARPQPAVTPLAAPSAAPASPPTPSVFHPPVYEPREGDVVEPFTRRRKLIAEHMVYSKTHSPHVGTVAEVDVTRVLALRQAHKAEFERREGFALTLLPFVAAATVRGLKEFPRMNASVVNDALVIRKQINLGIAVDTEEGLLVPVVKAAEGMSVVGLAREIERLRRKVAEKTITADDLSGGSFTLSNPGREGNLFGLAIINQPQVGILRMGEVRKRPVVIEADGTDALAIRSIMYLALSYDHRVIDGVLGNRFLFRVARIIEQADFEL